MKTAQTSNYAVCEGNSAEAAGQAGLTGSVLSVPPPRAWRWLLPRVLGLGAAEWEHSLLWLREWVRGTDNKRTRAALEMTALLIEHSELSEAHPDDFPDKAEAAGAGSSSPYRAVRGWSRSSSYIMHSDASIYDSWIPPTPCPSG